MKLKILGMALLACVATSAFAVTNASGTADGHFYHHNPNGNSAWITGEERATTTHELKFYRLDPNNHTKTASPIDPIHCEKSTYVGTAAAKSVTSIELTPTYFNCTTSEGTKVTIDVNGCAYTFSSQGTRKHGTVNIDCPKPLEITHPNCTIKIPTQTTAATLTEGIDYDEVVEQGGATSLTATVTVNTITGHFEGGICIFLGTSHKFKMLGSVTVKAYEHLGGTHKNPQEGGQVSITST